MPTGRTHGEHAWPMYPARRGFTTVELIGAVVLSLVLSAVALTGYRIYERDLPLRTSARKLTATFGAARALAISRNGFFAVKIDEVSNNFWIDETDALGTTIVPKVVHPEAFDKQVVLDSVSPVYVGSPIMVRFFPDGSSDDLYVYLQLLAKADSTLDSDFATVRLYGPTGQARVFEQQKLDPPAPTP